MGEKRKKRTGDCGPDASVRGFRWEDEPAVLSPSSWDGGIRGQGNKELIVQNFDRGLRAREKVALTPV